MNPYVLNEQFFPSDWKEFASIVLHSGGLKSSEYWFEMVPSMIRVGLPSLDGVSIDLMPLMRPEGYNRSSLPTTTNPGIYPPALIPLIRNGEVILWFVVEYQIVIPV